MRPIDILILFLLSIIGLQSYGQAEQKIIRLGLGFQGSSYIGDLTFEATPFYRFYPGINGSVQFGKLKTLNPMLNIGFSKFVSQNKAFADFEGYSVNKFVQNSFFYVDFRVKAVAFKKRKLNPYLTAGLGALTHSPQDENKNPLIDNFESRLEEETYSSIALAIPVGGGIDLRLNPVLAIGLDYTFRYTTSDYLDNISNFGPAPGNDMLHTLGVNLFITIDPEYPILKKYLRPRDQESQ